MTGDRFLSPEPSSSILNFFPSQQIIRQCWTEADDVSNHYGECHDHTSNGRGDKELNGGVGIIGKPLSYHIQTKWEQEIVNHIDIQGSLANILHHPAKLSVL